VGDRTNSICNALRYQVKGRESEKGTGYRIFGIKNSRTIK
jgi:hypothetical protein